MAVLVSEGVAGRQFDLRALEKRLDGQIGDRAIPARCFGGLRREPTINEHRPEGIDVGGAPTGMYDPKPLFLDPERQIPKPRDPGFVIGRILADLRKEGLVLVTILRALLPEARTKVVTVIRRIRGRPGDGVELVVSHHGASRSCVRHRPDKFKGAKLARAAIHEVADEDGGAARVPPCATSMPEAEMGQQCLKLVGMAVDVADDVVVHLLGLHRPGRSRTFGPRATGPGRLPRLYCARLAGDMHKRRSASYQRGMGKSDSPPLTEADRAKFKKTRISSEEISHFSIGDRTRDLLLDELEPHLRVFAVNGFKSPKDVSRLLNKAGVKTARGEPWTPQLVWFLLEMLFQRRQKRRLAKAAAPVHPKPKVTPMPVRRDANQQDRVPLTAEEMARRLSVLGRITK